jgi:photosystem II stability/assembly factor-like uncharacterized protein
MNFKTKIKVILLCFIIVFTPCNIVAQWQQTNGPGGDTLYITGLASDNINLYAASFKAGVFYSSNNGNEWIPLGLNSTPNVYLQCIHLLNNDIFAGGQSGIYKTTNFGINWIHSSFPDCVWSINSIGDILFACCNDFYFGGVFKSTDRGENWISTSLQNIDVWSIEASNNKIFAGTGWDGLFISSDYGDSWVNCSSFNYNGTICAIAITNSKIFVGASKKIYLSTNGGDNWSLILTASKLITSLISYDNIIMAGTDSTGIYVSENNGANWVQKNEGLIDLRITSLIIKDGYIFAGTKSKSVWKRALSDIIGITKISNSLPERFLLYQNFPNPFNPASTIKFDIKSKELIKLLVYDILGREVSTLVNEQLNPGTYSVSFDGSNLSSGVYYYRLTTDGMMVDTKKMILIK